MKPSAAAHALEVLPASPAVDDDLEAANLVFHEPRAVDSLPFRLTGEEFRLPYGPAVRKVISTPNAATADGWIHGLVVADLLTESGVSLSPEDRRDLAALPILPFSPPQARRAAAHVRRRFLLERKFELANAQRKDPNDSRLLVQDREILDELEVIRAFLDDPSGAGAPHARIASVIFTGARLRDLADREPIQPVSPGIPPKGHFTLEVGPSFVGKTAKNLHVAMARAAGVAPWDGAPAFEQGRTLVISPDEPVEQIARQIRRLAWNHPGGRMFDYFASIAVLGLDSTIPMDALAGLRFHEAGFALIDELLTGGGFDALVIDAYADMLPSGESEQENETASRIGGALEALAVKHSIPITLIHHVGKLGGQSSADVDVRDLGRGASALAAKARTIFTFEEVADFPSHRRIRTRTNLTRGPAPLDLLVSDRDTAGTSIDFFRPVDPATAWPIADVFPDVPSEWISTSELARRLSGQEAGKPSGQAVTMAGTVRGIWLGAGLIEVRKGEKRSTELRRIR